MDLLEYRSYCLSLPMAEECTPFDETTLVYKVGGKIFSLADMEEFCRINVKCDPELAVALRERHPEITPGWHMNKRLWNTVRTDGDLPDGFIRQQIRASYLLVAATLPRPLREEALRGVEAQ